MALRLGEILVRKGVMTPGQVSAVLTAQAHDKRPFGELAEEMFGVLNEHLEEAWADQYEQLTARIDPLVERSDEQTLRRLTPRQAWQFRMIPMRLDGVEIMVCTAREHLPRALRFAYRYLGPNCYFVLCQPEQLVEALARHYPMAGADRVLRAFHDTRAVAGG